MQTETTRGRQGTESSSSSPRTTRSISRGRQPLDPRDGTSVSTEQPRMTARPMVVGSDLLNRLRTHGQFSASMRPMDDARYSCSVQPMQQQSTTNFMTQSKMFAVDRQILSALEKKDVSAAVALIAEIPPEHLDRHQDAVLTTILHAIDAKDPAAVISTVEATLQASPALAERAINLTVTETIGRDIDDETIMGPFCESMRMNCRECLPLADPARVKSIIAAAIRNSHDLGLIAFMTFLPATHEPIVRGIVERCVADNSLQNLQAILNATSFGLDDAPILPSREIIMGAAEHARSHEAVGMLMHCVPGVHIDREVLNGIWWAAVERRNTQLLMSIIYSPAQRAAEFIAITKRDIASGFIPKDKCASLDECETVNEFLLLASLARIDEEARHWADGDVREGAITRDSRAGKRNPYERFAEKATKEYYRIDFENAAVEL